MTSLELTAEQAQAGYRPLAGRILLEIEHNAAMVGSLHVPEVAQAQTVERTQLLSARVIAVGFGRYIEGGEDYPGITEGDLQAGDRVLVAPLLQDLNRNVLITSVTRIEAILEE